MTDIEEEVGEEKEQKMKPDEEKKSTIRLIVCTVRVQNAANPSTRNLKLASDRRVERWKHNTPVDRDGVDGCSSGGRRRRPRSTTSVARTRCTSSEPYRIIVNNEGACFRTVDVDNGQGSDRGQISG
ncbi:hypothetical protein LSTR_LSTR008473 [Laodelphax striatellus]|uniref:Uncharacterized protein n=1 Tax=Laodelphax striatellus TaxID=195883 RepID=A0A482XVG9_LAOST|nr:hypothetical protein LSTR_LSTR008473 [Laodelphax striatellus]